MIEKGKKKGKRGGNHPENLMPPIKPGEIRNPKGFSEKGRRLKAFREYVTEFDNKAVASVIREKAKKGVPFFVETFLDRTHGKVPNKSELTGANGSPLQLSVSVLTPEAQTRLESLRSKLAGDSK